MAQRVPTTFYVAKRGVFIGGVEKTIGSSITSTQAKGLRRLSALVSRGHLQPNVTSSAKHKAITGVDALTAKRRRPEAYGAATRRAL